MVSSIEAKLRKFFTKKMIAGLISIIIIIGLLYAIFKYEHDTIKVEAVPIEELLGYTPGSIEGPQVGVPESYVENNDDGSASGHVDEYNSVDVATVGDKNWFVVWLDVQLSWQDEPAVNPLYKNEPDMLRIVLIDPTGNSTASDWGDSGTLTYTISMGKSEALSGNWTIVIEAGNCGDQVTKGPFGFLKQPDNGNDFSIRYEFKYYAPPTDRSTSR